MMPYYKSDDGQVFFFDAAPGEDARADLAEITDDEAAALLAPPALSDEDRRALLRPVSMRQARLALLGAGKLGLVDAAIAALPSPLREAARIEWEYAAEVRRDSGLIAGLAPALGLAETEIDALFEAAAGL